MRQYLTILLFSALSFFTSVQVHALGAATGVNNPLFSVKNKDTKVSKVASAGATFFYNTTVAKHTPQQTAQLDATLDQLSLQTFWDAFLAAHGFEENTSCAGTSVTLALAGGLALATKVGWLKRAWAMAEVAGAIGNIAVISNDSIKNSELGKVIETYNLAMGVIG